MGLSPLVLAAAVAAFLYALIVALFLYKILDSSFSVGKRVGLSLLVIFLPVLGWGLFFLFAKKSTKETKVSSPVSAPSTTPLDFSIEPQSDIPNLPEIADKTKVDVRYPLLAPYAYAHIHWDDPNTELVYDIEEPLLSSDEKKVLDILENGIRELINLSFIRVKDQQTVFAYLEKNVKVLLTELAIKIERDVYMKLMYYIYRDFVGLNDLEPLMNDYYIEDVECNGVNTPIYVVHRKYRNIRTSLVYPEITKLASFVEKLAQKCGKYISYAEPLLDGSLPDGSRVNSTYTTDVSSRGPTFTVRKFSKAPWSPMQLMQKGTVSPEMLAYLWMLIEYENSFMVVGGTGSGKTSLLNVLAFFIPPQARVVTIEDSVTGDSQLLIREENNSIRQITIKEFVDSCIPADVLTVNHQGKIIFTRPAQYIKHVVSKKIYEVVTATGRRIKVTQDHSLFTLGDEGLLEIKPLDIIAGKTCIAVPRLLPNIGTPLLEINLLDHLDVFAEDFLVGAPVQKIFSHFTASHMGVRKERYRWWKNHNIIKISVLRTLPVTFTFQEASQLFIKSRVTSHIPVLFSLTENFLAFCGLWLGDGSYDGHNKNVVIVSNVDFECRVVVQRVAHMLGAKYSAMQDKGVSLRIHSTVFYKFMKNVMRLEGYSATKKIPSLIFNLSQDQICPFIRGYFSADGTVKPYEVSCSSQSHSLLDDLQTLLLRLGIISRIHSAPRKDHCLELSISFAAHITLYKDLVGFLQERKNKRLATIVQPANHTVSDIIPLSIVKIEQLRSLVGRKKVSNYLNGFSYIGRAYLQKIAPIGSEFNDLSHTDILWDRVVSVTLVEQGPLEVFDLSIPGTEKFICNNILVHNTRELQLEHENWLPSVARSGVGLANLVGERYGEVSLFDLLKESFRQRPDYVIVGEVRGKEAYVLFQGMASGHPSFGTMHAESVETLVRRLTTPPISLSGSLIESLTAVCVMSPVKVKGKEVRRLIKIDEVISVPEGENGKPVTNVVFSWNPQNDTFLFNPSSTLFQKASTLFGLTYEQILQEFRVRAKLLATMYQRRIYGYKDVQRVIQEYYKDPNGTLRKFGL